MWNINQQFSYVDREIPKQYWPSEDAISAAETTEKIVLVGQKTTSTELTPPTPEASLDVENSDGELDEIGETGEIDEKGEIDESKLQKGGVKGDDERVAITSGEQAFLNTPNATKKRLKTRLTWRMIADAKETAGVIETPTNANVAIETPTNANVAVETPTNANVAVETLATATAEGTRASAKTADDADELVKRFAKHVTEGCRKWGSDEMQLKMKALDAVSHFFETHSLPYLMAAGSALGAARFGLVASPWDDDIDMVMPLDMGVRLYRISDELSQYRCDREWCQIAQEVNGTNTKMWKRRECENPHLQINSACRGATFPATTGGCMQVVAGQIIPYNGTLTGSLGTNETTVNLEAGKAMSSNGKFCPDQGATEEALDPHHAPRFMKDPGCDYMYCLKTEKAYMKKWLGWNKTKPAPPKKSWEYYSRCKPDAIHSEKPSIWGCGNPTDSHLLLPLLNTSLYSDVSASEEVVSQYTHMLFLYMYMYTCIVYPQRHYPNA